MKKFFALFLSISLAGLNVSAASQIEDTFANSTLDKSLTVKKVTSEPIYDDFAAASLNQNIQIKQLPCEPIYDTFAQKTLNSDLKIKPAGYSAIRDEFLPKTTAAKTVKNTNPDFDFESLDRTVIKIYPLNYYTTRTNLSEGQYINFALKENVKINNYEIKKDTPVKARVETVSDNGAYGVPANLTVDNFVINNTITAYGPIEISGANRSLWVYPAAAVLTPFFGIGILLLPIRGGHAKLRPNKTYQVYIDNPVKQNL